MITSRHTDLAWVLADCGVGITVAGKSTRGLVRAADAETLQGEDSPVAIVGRAVLISFQAGTLAPAEGSRVTVTEGPLAGSYRVDRILRSGDGELVRFLAYP